MEYRVAVTLVNDDSDPAPVSVGHILGHLLRGEGVISLTVAAVPQTREDGYSESLHQWADAQPAIQAPDGDGAGHRQQSQAGSRP